MRTGGVFYYLYSDTLRGLFRTKLREFSVNICAHFLTFSATLLLLSACGGGSSSGSGSEIDAGADSNTGDSTPGNSENASAAQAIDCSLDKSQDLPWPMPEYPGFNLPSGIVQSANGVEYIPQGLDPANWVYLVSVPLIFTYAGAREGSDYVGPQWNLEQENGVTATVDYVSPGATTGDEVWYFSRSGVSYMGEAYTGVVELEVRQPADCSLSFSQFDEQGQITGRYQGDRNTSVFYGYDEGELVSVTETHIRNDGGGETVFAPVDPGEAYPYSIFRWDSNGENGWYGKCADREGSNCEVSTSL